MVKKVKGGFGIAILAGALAATALARGGEIPAETDVLIAGGTTAAVEKALKARAEGKRVFIASPRPFFGEETAGRFELAPIEAEDEPVGQPVALKADKAATRARASVSLNGNDEITRVELVTYESPYGKKPEITQEAHFIWSEDGQTFSPVIGMPVAMNYSSHGRYVWRAPLNRRARHVAVGLTKAPRSTGVPKAEMIVYRKCAKGTKRAPTPLEAKVALDEALQRAGVEFVTGAMGVDVLTNGAGSVAGAVFATREGLREIRAKETIDASLHGVLVRAAGGEMTPLPAKMRLSRVVLSLEPPKAAGLAVEDLKRSVPVSFSFASPAKANAASARLYRCSFEWTTDDTPLGWAAAEETARRLTWTKGLVDAADELGFPARGCRRAARGLAYLSADGRMTWGKDPVRRTAAREIASCDVCVVGAGTAGAPATIAAARAGAKTIAVEYQYGLGGVGTLGMIGAYWYGTICGFTAEVDAGVKALGAAVKAAAKREWWRRAATEAGARVLMGSMAFGVEKRGNAIVGVKVATPFGAGLVRTKVAVDATGSADLAAAAGETTEFVTADEFALQSAGQAPRVPGVTYANTDFGYVNDNDAADSALFGLRARAGAKGEWDVSPVIGSRERRRMRGNFRVEPEDVINRRTFPDTIATGSTDFDTHGPTIADVCFLSPATETHVFKLNIPYRALLPARTEGLLVAGIGASAHRDAQPFMRMQADVQNEGYAAGRAAAQAARKGVSPRQIDVKELQRHLAEIGSIPKEALAWRDNFPLSDAAWAEAVKSAGDAFRGAPLVLTDRPRARRDILAAFKAETDPKRRLCYAQILGMLGEKAGAETLAANLRATAFTQVVPEDAKRFGKRMSNRETQIVALGRSRAECAVPVILGEIAKIRANTPPSRIRALALACSALRDPRLANGLAEKLSLKGLAGNWKKPGDALSPLAGFARTNGGYERAYVVKELALARALLLCGDSNGLARRVLEAYARDPRRIYAAHAQAVLNAASASVSVGERTFLTYPFSDPDPVPATDKTRYPYFRYDGSSPAGKPQAWKTVTLENDRIRVVLLPEVGGKVWGATDKVTGRDFLYANHVMKFRDIAMRGPWVSGGIEFNFGIIGHAPSSSTPVDWFVRTNADASVSCFVLSREYVTRGVWQVEVRLASCADRFETRVTWHNASGLPQPYYHWMNAAYSVRGNPEFLFPGRTAIGHQGEITTATWPLDEANRALDTFEGNAFGGPKSYHLLPGNNGFYGIWWPEQGFGSYHRNAPYEKFGRKIWLWALSREGGIWEDLLTDSDGQYTELQSGSLFNQTRGKNYLTPFKHRTFSPGETQTFTEYWGPLRDKREVAAECAAEAGEPRARPLRAPENFDWSSAWGEYVRGVQYLCERDDAKGEACLARAVEKDPFLAPAWDALGECALRRGDLKRVHDLAAKALAIDTYDPLANFLDGSASFLERDGVTARERLGVASLSVELRGAARALVARSYLAEGKRDEAARAARSALAANPLDESAILALAVALRGTDEAVRFAQENLVRFPLFHALRYELQKNGRERDFNRYIRNELPAETYLEMAAWYDETGYGDDARTMLRLAGENPLAKIALGEWEAAKKLSVAGVFPFRRESLASLERAVAVDGHWKFRYLLAVLKAYFGENERADALLASCGDAPDEAVFYQYRATRAKGEKALADLTRAQALGDSWRIGRALAAFHEERGEKAQMLAVTTAYVAKYPTCNPLILAHARALEKNARYRECLAYLKDVTLLPSEHADSGTAIWQACQKALGEPLTWPENLGKGAPYAPEKIDNRQIEQKREKSQMENLPILEGFERESGWTAETVEGVSRLARSQDRQREGAWTLRLTQRATGPKSAVTMRPAKPLPVPPEADTLCVWAWFDHFGEGANREPENPRATLSARFTKKGGGDIDVTLGRLNWRGWHALLAKLPNGLDAFAGFVLTGCTQKEDYDLYLDALSLFKEDLATPLTFRPSPKRNLLKPLKGADLGNNTGAGTLPFPTREETSMPASREPLPGEKTALFTGGAVKGSDPAKLEVTTHRRGRTLVVDLYAPPGAVTEIETGFPTEGKVVKTVTVPYLAIDGGKRIGVDILDNGLFRLGFADWYRSNASVVRVERNERGCSVHLVYLPDTQGRYKPVSERLFITLSPVFEEVLPTIANPVSPYRAVAGRKLWRVHAAHDRREDRRFWRLAHRLGMREVVINDHETQWRDTGESFTTCTNAAPAKGGDASLAAYSAFLRNDLGYTYGPYNNFTDLGSASPSFRLDRIARKPDGQFKPAWMRCWTMKPVWGPEACDIFAPALKRKFGFDTAYCDVHTALAPWVNTDYDARVPGAATFAATFYAYGEVMLNQKRAWQGPVYSEGSHHAFYAGLTDGNYAQDWGYDFSEQPWLVDFDLRKMHDLECSFGMGQLAMYSRPKTQLERQYYQPHASSPTERENLVDGFLGCTMAYGHTGFLVMDFCFEPFMKPFGRAYGPKSEFHPENGIGLAIALRSYYMIQQAAARYTQAKAKEIVYFDAAGRALSTSDALRSGAFARSQVGVSYDDGTCVVANHNAARLRATIFGRAIDLPPNGYAAWSADGTLNVEHGDAKGTAHPFDFAETPAYIFIDGRGTEAQSAKARSAGTAVCRREGAGWEVIPLGNVPCAFKVAGSRVLALDFEGRELGRAETRRTGDWLEITPFPAAFSYRID